MALKTINGIAVASIKTVHGVAAASVKTWGGETWTHGPQLALWMWGRGYAGGLGLGNTTNYSSPKQVGALTTWATISVGYDFWSLAVKTDGTLWAWGKNSPNYGVLGLGNLTNYSSPKQVGALTNWSKVFTSHGQWGSFAVKTDGTLWAWGRGITYGILGLGNLTNYSSPVQVGALTNWSSLSCTNGVVAVKTDGTLWSWGRGNYGQTGHGNSTNYSSPVQVGALTNWSKAAIGRVGHSVAVKTDGTLWSWGLNKSYDSGTYTWTRPGGQLGLGNTTNYSSPKQVGALTNWSSISVGKGTGSGYDSGFSLAARTDGTLWAWGNTTSGGMGLGATEKCSSPTQVGALTNWSEVSSRSKATMSLKTDGTIWSWGQNGFGQLGIGNTTTYSSPKQVGALTTWVSVCAGYTVSAGLK